MEEMYQRIFELIDITILFISILSCAEIFVLKDVGSVKLFNYNYLIFNHNFL